MAIPKAAPNDVFGYYFQYAVFAGKDDDCMVFLDTYRYDPVYPVIREEEAVWISVEDFRRIYAPYLHIEEKGGTCFVRYGTPDRREETMQAAPAQMKQGPDTLRLEIMSVMEFFEKTSWKGAGLSAVAVDAPSDAPAPFGSFAARKFYTNILEGKDRGEMNYALWIESAARMIPYRMYIPFSYDPAVPMKTLVCFHGEMPTRIICSSTPTGKLSALRSGTAISCWP